MYNRLLLKLSVADLGIFQHPAEDQMDGIHAQFKHDAIKLGDEVGNRKAAQELGVNGEKVERAESP